MKSVMSSRGQITVPVGVREKLGLLPGTVVHFQVGDGGAMIRKGTPGAHPVDSVYGKIRLERSVDALVDQMRGLRPKRRRDRGSSVGLRINDPSRRPIRRP
jgi:AbrB family looped-hinge helix DNA binding protein